MPALSVPFLGLRPIFPPSSAQIQFVLSFFFFNPGDRQTSSKHRCEQNLSAGNWKTAEKQYQVVWDVWEGSLAWMLFKKNYSCPQEGHSTNK